MIRKADLLIGIMIITVLLLGCRDFDDTLVYRQDDISNHSTTEVIEEENDAENIEYIYEEHENNEVYNRIIDEFDISDIENALKEQHILKRTSLREFIMTVASGDGSRIKKLLSRELNNIFTIELSSVKRIMIQLVAILLLGSIFVNLSSNIGGGFVSENGFFVTYMIATSILLSIFSMSMDITERSLDRIISVIKIIIPVYALAMNYVGQGTTASGMYEIIFIGIAIIQVIIKNIVLPMIKYYVLLSMVNYINKEDRFSKMSQLIKKIVMWLLKTLVVFVIGLNIVKTLINPQIDSIGRDTIKKVVSTIPGGSMISVLSGAFLGAGMLIKNSIGVTAMILIIIVLLFPVVKLLLIVFMVRITMVMIQPVGEKRYVNGIESTVNGISMLIHSVSSAAALLLITIALMAFSGRS